MLGLPLIHAKIRPSADALWFGAFTAGYDGEELVIDSDQGAIVGFPGGRQPSDHAQRWDHRPGRAEDPPRVARLLHGTIVSRVPRTLRRPSGARRRPVSAHEPLLDLSDQRGSAIRRGSVELHQARAGAYLQPQAAAAESMPRHDEAGGRALDAQGCSARGPSTARGVPWGGPPRLRGERRVRRVCGMRRSCSIRSARRCRQRPTPGVRWRRWC